MKRTYAFLDTNTLMHYRQPDEVDWLQFFGARAVTLIITPVVVRELERHKTFHPSKKLRKRVAALVTRLSRMLDEGSEVTVRSGVSLKLEGHEPTIDLLAHRLRSDVNDDLLIASVIEFRLAHPKSAVVLVTQDVGLKMKCRGHQVPVQSLGDELRLAEEPDDDDKRLKAAEVELERLRRRMPQLHVRFAGGTTRIELPREAVPVPTTSDIADQMSKVRLRHSRVVIGIPQRRVRDVLIGDPTTRQPLGPPPSDDEIEEALLENYFRDYEGFLRKRADRQARLARTAVIGFDVMNEGTAPADDVDVAVSFPPFVELFSYAPDTEEPEEPVPPMIPWLGEFVKFAQGMARAQEWLDSFQGSRTGSGVRPAHAMDLRETATGPIAEVHLSRVKHKFTAPLHPIYLRFPTPADVRSFRIECRINVSLRLSAPRAAA